ncbi:hypothetical protein TSUD_222640 [Trifolium subterraneum]|uniref:RRM domain-containing protein n=1 Tax=Trifolium subterraneum TaxID=3900 RepID=A0A2Z6M1W8_TRISU|nr:hypothetical protein TSUD_222640 [Trifolium subterraneum]
MAIPSSEETPKPTPTVHVNNIPQTVTAKDLLTYLESAIGSSSIFALEIFSEHNNWKSRGTGRVQFETFEAKSKALTLSNDEKLLFKSHFLRLTDSKDDIVPRPYFTRNRLNNCTLHAGFPIGVDCMSVLETWEGVRSWVMPERNRLEFWVSMVVSVISLRFNLKILWSLLGIVLVIPNQMHFS